MGSEARYQGIVAPQNGTDELIRALVALVQSAHAKRTAPTRPTTVTTRKGDTDAKPANVA